jgi:hypothetical protein
MRWFSAVVVVLVFAAVDRAYMRGETTRFAISIGQDVGAAINRKADDLLAYLKRR